MMAGGKADRIPAFLVWCASSFFVRDFACPSPQQFTPRGDLAQRNLDLLLTRQVCYLYGTPIHCRVPKSSHVGNFSLRDPTGWKLSDKCMFSDHTASWCVWSGIPPPFALTLKVCLYHLDSADLRSMTSCIVEPLGTLVKK